MIIVLSLVAIIAIVSLVVYCLTQHCRKPAYSPFSPNPPPSTSPSQPISALTPSSGIPRPSAYTYQTEDMPPGESPAPEPPTLETLYSRGPQYQDAVEEDEQDPFME